MNVFNSTVMQTTNVASKIAGLSYVPPLNSKMPVHFITLNLAVFTLFNVVVVVVL